jgi:hypothetical protein
MPADDPAGPLFSFGHKMAPEAQLVALLKGG